jgi:ParD-like antitoxin of type II bacterial toxin-antitoxin system
MSVAVRISDPLANKARSRSRAMHRSLAGQIEYWAEMGEILEDNPDLSFSFVQEIMIGREQANVGDLTPYQFDEGK